MKIREIKLRRATIPPTIEYAVSSPVPGRLFTYSVRVFLLLRDSCGITHESDCAREYGYRIRRGAIIYRDRPRCGTRRRYRRARFQRSSGSSGARRNLLFKRLHGQYIWSRHPYYGGDAEKRIALQNDALHICRRTEFILSIAVQNVIPNAQIQMFGQ